MLSAVVLTRNEEENIVDCLESLSFCDEVIVLDDNSKDRTVEVAKKLGAKVFTHSLANNFSAQRNYGLERAKHEWILFIDADERVTEELKNEVFYLIKTRGRDKLLNGYLIERRDVMWGRELRYGETANTWLLRLARKGTGTWIGNVHEEWKIKGIGKLENLLIHHPHPTITLFLKEINFYTDIRAHALYEGNVKTTWLAVIFYPAGKFLLNYVIRRGFLDGIPGFVVAAMMSLHSFLVRGKLWLLWQKV